MNKKDAMKVIGILKTADGGCTFCVRDLLKLFVKEFPQFKREVKIPRINSKFQ